MSVLLSLFQALPISCGLNCVNAFFVFKFHLKFSCRIQSVMLSLIITCFCMQIAAQTSWLIFCIYFPRVALNGANLYYRAPCIYCICISDGWVWCCVWLLKEYLKFHVYIKISFVKFASLFSLFLWGEILWCWIENQNDCLWIPFPSPLS